MTSLPILGADCDLILVHPSINSGVPYGFVLTPDPNHKTSAVSVQREITPEGVTTVYLFFTVILADELKNPDGSEHSATRAAMYSMLLDFLGQSEGLSVVTVLGTWTGIGPLGHSATELHLVNGSYISVKLGSVSTYHPPVSSTLFFGSLWQPTPPGETAFTWETSLWR
jgi:hypothetical protein